MWKYLTQCARGFQHGTTQACMVWDSSGGRERNKPGISLYPYRRSVSSAKEHLQLAVGEETASPCARARDRSSEMIREHELRLNLSNPGADALSYDVLANTQGWWWLLSFSSYYQHWKDLIQVGRNFCKQNKSLSSEKLSSDAKKNLSFLEWFNFYCIPDDIYFSLIKVQFAQQ